MDPNYPYQSHSSGMGHMGGYYPTTSAAPTSTEAGPTGEDFQQQGAAQLGYYGDPQAAPQPGPYYSYGGPQTGHGGSHGGSQVDYSHQYGYHPQPQACHGGECMPPPSTSQAAPSVAAVDEPAKPGGSGGFGGQDSQATGAELRPGYPKENVKAGWSVRSNWIYEGGMLVDGLRYTRDQFYGDYNLHWKHKAVSGEDLWEEFLNLRFKYLGY
ncbi:hypothetical protein INS49_007865 [Diaporthe citri]|uniref:uncharacterized protein n=1 Tax=Diaporthe citri TaxID=83186 RepID=UPI001C7F7E02|nr:uncharacterized protein INS49_007865 [Diaporthe citri]KAG6362771.1 hypothetical protein INS49_007865 [Diaporthe citri]